MKAKNRFWRILRMVACESFRARTMPPRSPFRSVIPALSIATSVPVPMAMPTSDAPGVSQLCDHRALLVRHHLRLDVSDAEPSRHRPGGGRVVAGQHDDLDAL